MRPLYPAIALTGVVALAVATSTVAASFNSAPPGVTIADPAPTQTAAAGDPSTVTLRIGGSDLIRIALPRSVTVVPQRTWFGWCAPWRVFRPN